MTKNKVLVLGGSGFIGREIVQSLLNNNVNVVVGCRDLKKAGFLEKIQGNGNISIVPTDVTNRDDVKKVIQQADAVVSLVGILFESKNNTFEAVQGNAPGIISEEAKKAGVSKLVHISALGANRFSLSKYASSKALGEEMLLKNFPQATILRPSIVFGKDDNFFNKFSRMATLSPFLPLIGGGRTLFQPVYVKDVSNAVLKILYDTKTNGKLYELGGPSIYSFKELIELTMKISKKPRLLLNLPFWLAHLQARCMELLPNPVLTCDQLELLKQDNIVGIGAQTLADLDISATDCKLILPTYL
ncbi:MAG: complex I NDUFA9 subunit family protein [Thalassobaculaceae bacterium]